MNKSDPISNFTFKIDNSVECSTGGKLEAQENMCDTGSAGEGTAVEKDLHGADTTSEGATVEEAMRGADPTGEGATVVDDICETGTGERIRFQGDISTGAVGEVITVDKDTGETAEKSVVSLKTVNDEECNVILEGSAIMLFPKGNQVFYNKVQEFNRDLTCAVLTEFSSQCYVKKHGGNVAKKPSDYQTFTPGKYYDEGISIFEGLSASGLRSIRFAKEIPGIKEVIANDWNFDAVDTIKCNVKHNEVEHLVKATQSDAAGYMYSFAGKHKNKFDVIDIDPYGSPAVFLDAAVQALRDGGMLCITCTDTAVLCGNGSETCFAKYGGMSLKAKHCHEMAIRLLLNCLESHANHYSRYIVPILSLSIDFYIRVFVRIYTSPKIVQSSASKRAIVFNCSGCDTYNLQYMSETVQSGQNVRYKHSRGPPTSPNCRHCGSVHHVGGPIWASKLHDTQFLKQVVANVSTNEALFKTSKRIIGMLSVAIDELEDPLYYVMDKLCTCVGCPAPKSVMFRSALLNAGFNVSGTHANQNGFKTNAPSDTVWDIMRSLAKHYAKPLPGSIAGKILSKQPIFIPNFEVHPSSVERSKAQGLLRFQVNPEPNWGPKSRAKKTNQLHTSDTSASTSVADTKPVPSLFASVSHGDNFVVDSRSSVKKRKRMNGPKRACKMYKKGKCNRGTDCKFRHAAPNEQSCEGSVVTEEPVSEPSCKGNYSYTYLFDY